MFFKSNFKSDFSIFLPRAFHTVPDNVPFIQTRQIVLFIYRNLKALKTLQKALQYD
jgi:hypothetical protein